MKKNGDITIKGGKISINGSGDVAIKGSKIKENWFMQRSGAEPSTLPDLWDSVSSTVRVGRIVRQTTEGQALVDFPGNPFEEIEARLVVGLAAPSCEYGNVDLPVLLVFENGDPTLPIIIGFVQNAFPAPHHQAAAVISDVQRSSPTAVDRETIIFRALGEIVLQCGKSSIILRNDGTIAIKGSKIVSRSSGEHKIKGASVRIN
jgi:hypothetical protein